MHIPTVPTMEDIDRQIAGTRASLASKLSEVDKLRAALQQTKEEAICPHASRIAEQALDGK